jgi:hypothetical protein
VSRPPTAAIELHLGRRRFTLRTPAGLTQRAPGTEGAAATLQRLLESALAGAGPAPRGGWHAEVVLDDGLCWFDIVQGDFASRGAQAMQWIAEACAQEIFGNAVHTQTLRWQVQADGRHALLLAVESTWLGAVQDALRAQRIALHRMQPAFVVAWNRARGRVNGLENGLVAWLHDGQAVLVHLRGGSMVALAREALDATAAALELAARRLVARHGELLSAPVRRLLLTDEALQSPSVAPWELRRVSPDIAPGLIPAAGAAA